MLSLGTAQSSAYLNTIYKPGSDASNTSDFLYVSAGFGFALLVAAWLFFRVTGALFNPNIATALVILGVIKPFRYILFVIAQLVGGICAAAIVQGLMPGELNVNTVPSPGINRAQALFIEMFVTSFLTLAVLMLAVEKHRSTPFAPVGVGMTLFICELWSIPLTGGSVNTARSFGPAVVTNFHNTHWIYWLGPTLGALLATAVYIFAKRSKYWTLTPDQDSVDHRKSPNDLPLAARSPTRADGNGGQLGQSSTSRGGRASDATAAGDPLSQAEKGRGQATGSGLASGVEHA
ncbi:aquaporin-like protein [Exidia glandulosa HHB12029]|uniref:Aquaporin-like protein n=1 Tax=Exidia glandulosa HHB12029 TaxID=1314781 RepID=A0A165GYF9_EXIGL|nr:aquaporin-like protein [Exidia glandulosa HHB12029]